jgi:hypothetical protein
MAGLQYLLVGVQAQSARVIEVCLPAHGNHMLIMCDVLSNLKGYGVASFFGTCDTIMIVSTNSMWSICSLTVVLMHPSV